MKNSKLTSLLTCTLLLSTLSCLTIASADEISAGSNGTVDFKHRINPNPEPYDPTDPTVPPREVEALPDGEGKGTIGLLRFERVPNFKFETIEIRGQDQIGRVLEEAYTVKDKEETFYAAPTVEISDERGTWNGWTAFVSIEDEFKNVDQPTIAPIKGFELKLNHAQVSGYSGIKDEESVKPTFKPITLTDQPQQFAVADKDKGMAQWGLSFYGAPGEDGPVDGKPAANTSGVAKASNAVTLTIPAGATKVAKDKYVANMTWYLATTPDATVPDK